MTAVRTARRGVYDKVLQNWSPDERAALAGALERFNESLEAYMRAPRP
jgi:hypothetical protein